MKKNTSKRIAIIGNPGSGKSTLATRLGVLLDIPVHHLDTHVFVNGKKTDQQKVIQIQQKLVSKDVWIIEGCSFSALEMRFEKPDMVIYLDIPRLQCIWRVLKRCFAFDESLANSGCVRLPNWTLNKYIWNFEKDKKPRKNYFHQDD
ncbi:MAG: AAA family ATPase [Chlamydiales bacterium]|nr:AAA family ATPase [Chlamydiales bacterium]